MTRIFKDQIGCNVEVYIDDMLIKTKEKDGHVGDLDEAFRVLRHHQVRLNPEKCVFDVTSGKFISFMLTKQGIEANPEKVEAVMSLVRAHDHEMTSRG